LSNRLDEMERKVYAKLYEQGFMYSQIKIELFLNLRYEGTNCSLMCRVAKENQSKIFMMENFRDVFVKRQDFID